MEKAIKLLSLVDEYNFIPVYFVTETIKGNRVIRSVAFLSREEAQNHCDYLNEIKHTNYHVYETSAFV